MLKHSGFIFSQEIVKTEAIKNDFVSPTIQAILDLVSFNQLLSTEKHLTGEEPFWIYSEFDSIQTRYSYSRQIETARVLKD